MKILWCIFISISMTLSAEKVHSNAEPSPYLKKTLKRTVPRFKVSDMEIWEVLEILREELRGKDPDQAGVNIVFLPKEGVYQYEGLIDSEEIEDPFADEPLEDPFADPLKEGESFKDLEDLEALKSTKQYNFDFENMKVEEIFAHIATAGNLKYRIDENAVVVADAGVYLRADKEWTEKFIRERLKKTNEKIKSLQQEAEALKRMLEGEKPVEKVLPKTKVEKILSIVIPKIRFEDRNIEFAVDFFKRKTRELSEDGDGLNIIFKIEKDLPLINLDLDNMPVKDLMDYMAEQLRINYRITESAIIFYYHDKLEFSKVTYDINQDFVKLMTKGKELRIKERLQELGIKFRMGSNFMLFKEKNKFEMFNTNEDHEKLKKLIDNAGKLK